MFLVAMLSIYLFIYLFIYLLSAPLHACADKDDCHTWALCQHGKCKCQGERTGNGKYCRGTFGWLSTRMQLTGKYMKVSCLDVIYSVLCSYHFQ